MSESQQMQKASEGFWLRIIYIVSAIVCGAVAFLILGPRPEGLEGSLDVSGLPRVNALLNGTTAVLLVLAVVLVKNGKIEAHKRTMLVAFATSTAFLVTYVIYHTFKAGPAQYVGDHRSFYLFILLTHIVLAAAVVPLALITLYRGWTMQVEKHKKIAKISFPIWLYVSVTGIVVYAMLYL